MGQVPKKKRTWNLVPVLQIVWKLLPINWSNLVTSWVMVQKIYWKIYLLSCTNTHRDVTDSVDHGMVKNTKTWISWEWNIIFLRNKKILNLCLRWHILRSYCFVSEVTFKDNLKVYFLLFYEILIKLAFLIVLINRLCHLYISWQKTFPKKIHWWSSWYDLCSLF